MMVHSMNVEYVALTGVKTHSPAPSPPLKSHEITLKYDLVIKGGDVSIYETIVGKYMNLSATGGDVEHVINIH